MYIFIYLEEWSASPERRPPDAPPPPSNLGTG